MFYEHIREDIYHECRSGLEDLAIEIADVYADNGPFGYTDDQFNFVLDDIEQCLLDEDYSSVLQDSVTDMVLRVVMQFRLNNETIIESIMIGIVEEIRYDDDGA